VTPAKQAPFALRSPFLHHRAHLGLYLACLTACIAFLGITSQANALSPWLHLTSGSRPSYLSVNSGLPNKPGVDEVQQITIGETERIVIVGPKVTQHQIEEEEFFEPGQHVELTSTTTEAEAQQGIQELEGYGPGNVQVHRVDASHYTVTFVGSLAERPVPLMQQGYVGLGSVSELKAGKLPTSSGKPAKPGVDEVQEIVIGETERIVIVGPKVTQHQIEEEEFFEPGQHVELTTSTTEAEAQAGIQELEGYGAGNVQVKRIDASHYKVTFLGALAERPVPLMQQGYIGLGEVKELTAGSLPVPAVPPNNGELDMTVENVGDANLDGSKSTFRMTDVLPVGLKAVGVAATKPFKEGNFQAREPIPCSLEEKGGRQVASCTLGASLVPYDQLEMRITVQVQSGAHTGELNELSTSGGGAAPTAIKRPITISQETVPFGVESYEMGLEEEGGATTTQAGSHPFQLTTTIALNQLEDINPLVTPPQFRPEVIPPALAKDLNFKLPAGLIGNPTSIPQCTTTQFFETVEGKENKCPPASAVGVATATVHEPATVGTSTITEPIFNLEPRQGEPARFGFYVVLANSPVFIDTSVRSGGDYGVTVSVNNITQTAAFLSSEVTFWGTPADPRHDKQRGWGCLYEARNGTVNQPCIASEEQHPKPFLSLPTSCGAQLQTSVQGDPWSAPGSFFAFTGAFEPSEALLGCNRLSFGPQLQVKSDSQEASSPTGMNIDVHVPQEANQNAQGTTSSNIRSVKVLFPPGVSLNPSAADGLQACSEGQVGYLAAKGPAEELLFTSTLPEPFCPDAAKVGTVRIKTPLLPAGQNLEEGGLYLATPAPNGEGGRNPFNTLVAMYIVVKDPVSGVLVKLPGSVSLDQSTGQITSTFQNTPDLTFEDAEIHLTAGPRAPLASPATCGSYPVTATFTPWSGTAPVSSTSSLQVSSGPGGSPCPTSTPFSPSLAAGTTNNNAGALSPLSTTINRSDGNQQLQSVSLHTPPGISGVLKGVTLCPEAQADTGTCPANSLIGHSTVGVGFGADPFTVTGGQVFLTEGYKGAPFGLSILTPAIAGPFNLGNVIVRARIEVDPHTAALTVTTDESGPYAIPHILDGVPLALRHVNVTVDRPGFTFNPTSCAPLSITATLKSLEGASAALASPYQAANCQSLKFAPKFAVSTSARATKANGTSLKVRLSYPSAPLGTYANVAKVKVSLPKALPSRLTTLQKACTSQTFDADPGKCPGESIVGHAEVITPLLPVPLTGNAYFVSHASEAFPDLTIVLKGYGITVDLVGSTNIKNGITTTTFKSTPDVPFSSFELNLPAQKYSALTANTNLCKSPLIMPTEFQAQNGAELHQSTRISVTGCPRALTNRQKLAKALKACKRKHGKGRSKCEAQARGRYGAKKAKGKKGSGRKK
jgi:hypothetical protein